MNWGFTLTVWFFFPEAMSTKGLWQYKGNMLSEDYIYLCWKQTGGSRWLPAFICDLNGDQILQLNQKELNSHLFYIKSSQTVETKQTGTFACILKSSNLRVGGELLKHLCWVSTVVILQSFSSACRFTYCIIQKTGQRHEAESLLCFMLCILHTLRIHHHMQRLIIYLEGKVQIC